MFRTPRAGVEFGDVVLTWYANQGETPLVSPRGQLQDHIALSVVDLDAWVAKLRGEGVVFLEEPYRVSPRQHARGDDRGSEPGSVGAGGGTLASPATGGGAWQLSVYSAIAISRRDWIEIGEQPLRHTAHFGRRLAAVWLGPQ